MRKITCRLTVFFDNPFWAGLYERESGGTYEACKITFGAEPTDGELYLFLQQNWRRLPFSPPVAAANRQKQAVNPKRMQREIRRALERPVVGTKAQQALSAQRQEQKQTGRVRSRETREQEQQARYEKRQHKRREKHRGH